MLSHVEIYDKRSAHEYVEWPFLPDKSESESSISNLVHWFLIFEVHNMGEKTQIYGDTQTIDYWRCVKIKKFGKND